MDKEKSLIIFCFAFILAFVYWRLKVFITYMDGGISYLRELTGLTIHHYHTGLLILTIALLLYLFYKQNNIILSFLGFGLGTVLDSFMSRLFKAETRIQEIANYNFNFYNTLLFFGVVLVTGVIFYLINERYKKH
jgi:hypothetical protein